MERINSESIDTSDEEESSEEEQEEIVDEVKVLKMLVKDSKLKFPCMKVIWMLNNSWTGSML